MNMLLILWEKKETVLSHDVIKVNNLMDIVREKNTIYRIQWRTNT